MSTRLDRARALVTQIKDILTQYGPDGDRVPVTLDARDLDRKTLQHGIVLVSPGPRMEWPTGPAVTRLTWTVYVLQKAGTALIEWEQTDWIMDALIAAALPMQDAEPVEVPRPAPAPALPGYQLTITDDYLN